jgi:hypothetical protein
MRADDRAINRAIDDKFRMPLFVVFERPMVCALSALGLGRSVVTCVKVPYYKFQNNCTFDLFSSNEQSVEESFPECTGVRSFLHD